MLGRGLTSTILARSPFSSSIVYLIIGLIAGPMVLNIFRFNPITEAPLLETLTEVAVLISLFSAGIKMPVPVTVKQWTRPVLLAWLSMTLTVALVAAFTYFIFNFPIGLAILLGAILAPTDPVLATDVQSRHPGDKDHLRFNLTCEAGMNDGSAFPFVMLGLGLLGLHELGDSGWKWITLDVLWATSAAIAIGICGGVLLAQVGWRLRGTELKHEVLDDLVGFGLIALVYGISLSVGAWGFLAVFFSGVALRQRELKLSERRSRKIEMAKRKDSSLEVSPEDAAPPIISVEALVFGAHLERLSEMLLVFLLGGMLAFQFWNWQSISLAIFLFVVARPLSVYLSLAGTNTTWKLRSMIGWFGVRGIGSIYYLMYAIQHGLDKTHANQLTQLTLVVITLSIIVHGTSVKPIMEKFWRRK
ncbi:MAG: sodium:proton antiporter [Gammaproteobacteria bacterium]|nr:MAG: sodium:proton antiporter [Gammaproteobacteria bacterium]